MKKEYEVYFLEEDYMETFKTLKEARDFIKGCVQFDKENDNPYGAKKSNYTIVTIENEVDENGKY